MKLEVKKFEERPQDHHNDYLGFVHMSVQQCWISMVRKLCL